MFITRKTLWSSLVLAALALIGTIASAAARKCLCTFCYFQAGFVGTAVVTAGNDLTECKDLNNEGADGHKSGSNKQTDQGWLVCSRCVDEKGPVSSDFTYDN